MQPLDHGFAHSRCTDCVHDDSVAFSCKGRGVCPSCNTRRMAKTAAHLTDHVSPRLPVRQWVLSVPKRLRYFMQRDGAVLNHGAAHLLAGDRPKPTVEQLRRGGCKQSGSAYWRSGLHSSLGSSLNEHVHFIWAQ
jgi:hypothetical protein